MLPTPVVASIVLALVCVVGWVLSRSGELCMISVRRGRALVVRGALPKSLVHDFRAVLEKPHVRRATVYVRRGESHARVEASGVGESDAQRLRNVLGAHPWHRLRTATAPSSSRNLGQLLGVAWLAWALHRR